jgi:hypothetical protein
MDRQLMKGRTVVRRIACTAASLFMFGCPFGGPRVNAGANVTYDRIRIEGESARGGVYDPSIAYDASGRTGWLAYSAIFGNMKPMGPFIETHVARTTDGGRTWRFVGVVNHSRDDELQYEGGSLAGAWRYEVPTIVRDPGDAERPWKLFAHRYFWNEKKDRMPTYGWITMQTSRDPSGPWSEDVALFGAGQFPLAPYHRAQIDANALDPSLANTVAYTEPGAFERNGVLYLSLTAHKRGGLGGPRPDIVLLRSRDHGANWGYAGTLVSYDDAKALGYRFLDASAIAEEKGRVFLLTSPDTGKTMHDGTVVFEFDDLDRAKLKRDAKGELSRHKVIPGQAQYMTRSGAGQACYSEHNTAGGLVMAQLAIPLLPTPLQIWSTGQDLIDSDGRPAQRQ